MIIMYLLKVKNLIFKNFKIIILNNKNIYIVLKYRYNLNINFKNIIGSPEKLK